MCGPPIPGFDAYAKLTARLGKFKTGKSCLYVKGLGAMDRSVLSQLLAESVAYIREKYPAS